MTAAAAVPAMTKTRAMTIKAAALRPMLTARLGLADEPVVAEPPNAEDNAIAAPNLAAGKAATAPATGLANKRFPRRNERERCGTRRLGRSGCCHRLMRLRSSVACMPPPPSCCARCTTIAAYIGCSVLRRCRSELRACSKSWMPAVKSSECLASRKRTTYVTACIRWREQRQRCGCVCVCVCVCVQNLKKGCLRFGRASENVLSRVIAATCIGDGSFVIDVGSGDGYVKWARVAAGAHIGATPRLTR